MIDLHLPPPGTPEGRPTLDELVDQLAEAEALGRRLLRIGRAQLEEAVDLSQYIDGLRWQRTGDRAVVNSGAHMAATATALGLNYRELSNRVYAAAFQINERLKPTVWAADS